MQIELHKITVRELTNGYVDNNENGVRAYGGRLDVRPPYQREFVYKEKQRDAVIDTLTQGFPLNVMYWAVRDDDTFEIIDGQQRTISLCQFARGDFHYDMRFFSNLTPEEQGRFLDYRLMVYVCDGGDERDLKRCMEKLRAFHAMRLKVDHTFDIFGQIEFYETLWEGEPSVYRDYSRTKEQVLSLRPFIDSLEKDWCLTHIDAIPDNFLFYQTESGEALQLTDWEYSGMQDPHVDIAMFCIYCLYDRRQCDRLMDIYFEGACDRLTRAKIYAYIAMCGLLWSNWCEFKRRLGVEFGEYSLRQYRYAKDFYRCAKEQMEEA